MLPIDCKGQELQICLPEMGQTLASGCSRCLYWPGCTEAYDTGLAASFGSTLWDHDHVSPSMLNMVKRVQTLNSLLSKHNNLSAKSVGVKMYW